MADKPTIKDLLQFFPTVELPVTVSGDTINTFDAVNDVLSSAIIEAFIIPWEEGKEIDEYTEFVPCFQLPEDGDYHGIVYWKGGLLKYEYILITIDKHTKNLVSRKSIAGTIAEGGVVKKSVAQIDEDSIIHIMAGVSPDGESYDPNNSQAFNMEILSSGEVIFTLGDE